MQGSKSTKDLAHLKEMIEEIKFCMLTTVDDDEILGGVVAVSPEGIHAGDGGDAVREFDLGVVAKQIPARPEDRSDGEIAEGAGEQGFFPPYSWWPMFCALALATIVMGIVIGWWLFIIGAGASVLAVIGLVFEYYRGEHAH